MKKHILFNGLYLLIIVLTILLGSGTINLVTECDFYKLYYSTNIFKITLVFFIPIIGYIISIILKHKKAIKVIYFAIIPIIPVFIIFNLIDNRQEKLFLTNKYIITKGVVIKKGRQKMSASITVSYSKNSNKVKTKRSIDTKDFKNIHLGDTVLMRYDVNCGYLSGIFNIFPTKTQLEKCKNDCYYDNGKLIEKIE